MSSAAVLQEGISASSAADDTAPKCNSSLRAVSYIILNFFDTFDFAPYGKKFFWP
jgi:hypothetical protein